MESFKNIGSIHESCAEEKLKKFQSENPNLTLKNGQYAKVRFENELHTPEWMWVEITNHNNESRTFSGTLANDPIVITHIAFGSKVNDLSYDRICEIYN